MEELPLNVPVTRTVPADNPWYQTGLMLRKGAVYRFEVLPKEQTWIDAKLAPFTADGRTMAHLFLLKPFFRMPMVKWFALLGSIGKDRSTYFRIGTFKDDFRPEKDGELVCFANDVLGFGRYENNSGSITLTITRIT